MRSIHAGEAKTSRLFVVGFLAACGVVMAGCGGAKSANSAPSVVGGSKDPTKWPTDDRSLCNWHGHPELEISETTGPGSLKPNIRRVFKVIGEGDQRKNVLVCREVDTNLDGIKDTFRTFGDKGEAKQEEADTNYDGRMDVWLLFAEGRLAEEKTDTNFDGAPDVWKVYVQGGLSRIKRDRNFDGKPDIWEIYTKGHLERIGYDESNDGHIDRWDRDELARLAAEEEDRKLREAKEAEEAKKKAEQKEADEKASAELRGSKKKKPATTEVKPDVQ